MKKLIYSTLFMSSMAFAEMPTPELEYGTCEKYAYNIDYDNVLKEKLFKIIDIKSGQVVDEKRLKIGLVNEGGVLYEYDISDQ